MENKKMKDLRVYSGATLVALTLSGLSQITGLSKSAGDEFINETRRSHFVESRKTGAPNKYEAHYANYGEFYHDSAEVGFSAFMALMGFAGAINTVNIKRKAK